MRGTSKRSACFRIQLTVKRFGKCSPLACLGRRKAWIWWTVAPVFKNLSLVNGFNFFFFFKFQKLEVLDILSIIFTPFTITQNWSSNSTNSISLIQFLSILLLSHYSLCGQLLPTYLLCTLVLLPHWWYTYITQKLNMKISSSLF